MGLFDELLGNALGTQGDERAKQSSSLVSGLLELIDEPETGGLAGLQGRGAGQGLGDLVASWIGTGRNQPISADQITSLLGAKRVDAVGQGAGLSGSLAAGAIAAILPALIDKLTPDGEVPPSGELQQRSRAILRDLPAGAPAAPARPRADFSDVRASAGTTERPAAPAKLQEPEVYVVVAGDSLSKIAKRFFGDANQWRRIFEANRDQIQNPDLIRPGQKLKIPKT